MSDIEYKLKILLKSTTLSVTSIRDISDPSASQAFQKKYSATRKIHAFIKSTASLSKTNIEVPLFSAPINPNDLKHRLLFCEVAVGDSLFVSKDYALMCQPPSSFDSFIIQNEIKEDDDEYGRNEKRSEYENNNYLDDNYRKEMRDVDDVYKRDTYDQRYRDDQRHRDDHRYRDDQRYRETDNRKSRPNYDTIQMHGYTQSKDEPQDKYAIRKDSSPTKQYDYEKKHYDEQGKIQDTRQSMKENETNLCMPQDLSTQKLNLNAFLYIIKDPSKINLIYEVGFNYDKELEQKQKGQCEMCGKNPAIMFCLAERASFCKFCEEGIHDNEFTKRHQRYYYDSPDKKKKFISCAYHYDSIVDFYCEVCNVPVCSLCKIHGNHSAPPFSQHKLIRFLDACDLIKERMTNEEDELKHLNECIRNNIAVFKSDLDEFSKMVNAAKNKIEGEYKNAMNELNSIVRKRFQVYNGIYIEKNIALERCDRIHTYIRESDGGQNVKDYKTILEQKEEMKVKEIRLPIEKIKIDGYLNVYSENAKKDTSTESVKSEQRRKGSDQYVDTKSKRE